MRDITQIVLQINTYINYMCEMNKHTKCESIMCE